MLLRLDEKGQEEIIFLESKVGSVLSGEDQLQLYARILASLPTAAKKTLLFITRDYLPQEVNEVMSGIPIEKRPHFKQKRWYDFAEFISSIKALSSDTLATELLTYMNEQQLDRVNYFTPADIAAITAFPHALSVMRSVFDGELKERFEREIGSLGDDYDRNAKVAKLGMLSLQSAPRNRLITATLGFWFADTDNGFPILYGDIGFESKNRQKKKIVAAMQEFVARKDSWKEDNVSVTAPWGRIYKNSTMALALADNDHVAQIQKVLGGILDDMVEFKRSYPDLLWVDGKSAT